MGNIGAWTANDQSLRRMRSWGMMCAIEFIADKELEQQEPEVSSRTDMVEDRRKLRLIIV